ncbi:MAG TPA: hypothetical protein VN026_16005, partial [Bacteroidia bacterium]|nr:hypothetical protein [Bacteroidia bacterium]
YPYGGYGYGYGYPVPYYPATQPIIIKEQTTTANTTNTTDNKVPNNGLTNSIKQEINKGVEAYKTNSNVKVAVIGGAVLFGLLMIFK